MAYLQGTVQEPTQQLPPAAHRCQLAQDRVRLPRTDLALFLRRGHCVVVAVPAVAKATLHDVRTRRLGLLCCRRFPEHPDASEPMRADFPDPSSYPSLLFPVGEDFETDLVCFRHERPGNRDHLALAVVFLDDRLMLGQDQGDRLEQRSEEGGKVRRGLTCEKMQARSTDPPLAPPAYSTVQVLTFGTECTRLGSHYARHPFSVDLKSRRVLLDDREQLEVAIDVVGVVGGGSCSEGRDKGLEQRCSELRQGRRRRRRQIRSRLQAERVASISRSRGLSGLLRSGLTTTASAKPLEMTSASIAMARCILRVADSQSCFCIAESSAAIADFKSWTAWTMSMHCFTRDCRESQKGSARATRGRKFYGWTDLFLVQAPDFGSDAFCRFCDNSDLVRHVRCLCRDASDDVAEVVEGAQLGREPRAGRDERRKAVVEFRLSRREHGEALFDVVPRREHFWRERGRRVVVIGAGMWCSSRRTGRRDGADRHLSATSQGCAARAALDAHADSSLADRERNGLWLESTKRTLADDAAFSLFRRPPTPFPCTQVTCSVTADVCRLVRRPL